MNRTLVAGALAAIVLLGCLLLLTQGGSRELAGASKLDANTPLVLFCAASNRAVMEAVRADYEKEFGREVQIQYGPSQTLLSSLEVSRTGDLYLPADDSFITLARDRSLVAEVLPLASMRAVVAIRKGNPKGIRTFDDLLRPGVRVVQADPEATAIGKVVREALRSNGLWEKISQAIIANRTTVTDVANDIVLGSADAGFVYDAVLHTYPDLEAIDLPELSAATSRVSLGVSTSSQQPQAALHFARYVAARDRGLLRYGENGFKVVTGDVWESTPELTFYAGSMLRPAIDDTITKFEAREGVRVARVYNGCGVLVAQMKAGQRPDAYFACDTEFMKQVPDLFPEAVNVSQNELVILVQKGNPHGIASLKDLGKQGVRVGIGHEKQCAMGWLTQNTFREGGVQAEVMANVSVQTPSGDMLVNQLRTGSLDAAVAYLSNAAGAADFLDAVEIRGLPCSVATQPLAVAPDSPRAQTTGRLFERIVSLESQDSFEAEGFRWQLVTDLSALDLKAKVSE